MGSVPDWGTKIPHAMVVWLKKKNTGHVIQHNVLNPITANSALCLKSSISSLFLYYPEMKFIGNTTYKYN